MHSISCKHYRDEGAKQSRLLCPIKDSKKGKANPKRTVRKTHYAELAVRSWH